MLVFFRKYDQKCKSKRTQIALTHIMSCIKGYKLTFFPDPPPSYKLFKQNFNQDSANFKIIPQKHPKEWKQCSLTLLPFQTWYTRFSIRVNPCTAQAQYDRLGTCSCCSSQSQFTLCRARENCNKRLGFGSGLTYSEEKE